MDDGELEDQEQARRSEVMADALRHATFGRPKDNRAAGIAARADRCEQPAKVLEPSDPDPHGAR